MLTNTDCTLYRFDSTTGGYTRQLLHGVYWNETSGKTVQKSGLQDTGGVKVFVFCDVLPLTPTKDFLVKGLCDFVFTGTTQQEVSEEMKAFRSRHSFVTVMSVKDCLYGGSPHVEVACV